MPEKEKPKGKGRASSQWKKGQSGNPKGRPPNDKCMSRILEQKISEYRATKNGEVIDPKTALCEAMISMAFDKETPPNVRFQIIREIMDRTEGKALQRTEVTGNVTNKEPNIADMVDLNKLTMEEREILLKAVAKKDD